MNINDGKTAKFRRDISAAPARFRFTLIVEVDNPTALWRAAAQRCIEDGLDLDDLSELIGPSADPMIEECLMVLSLPQSIEGATMVDVNLAPELLPAVTVPPVIPQAGRLRLAV